MSREPLLVVEDLSRHFPINGGLFRRSTQVIKAVDRVDLAIGKGETMGLVGESGSGKTTLGRCILRLVEPTAGEVIFEGRDIAGIKQEDMRKLRRDMQIVFQEPFDSLNPQMPIG